MTLIERGGSFEGVSTKESLLIQGILQWITLNTPEVRQNPYHRIAPVYQFAIGDTVTDWTHIIDYEGKYQQFRPAGYTLAYPLDPYENDIPVRWFGIDMAQDKNRGKVWVIEDKKVWEWRKHYQGALYLFSTFPSWQVVTHLFQQESYKGLVPVVPDAEAHYLDQRPNVEPPRFHSYPGPPPNRTEIATLRIRRAKQNRRWKGF